MTIVSATVLLFLVLDPLGNVPLFVVALKDVQAHHGTRRVRAIILREALIGLAVLMIFLFTGRHLLAMLNVTQASLGVAGGIILLMIAIKMIFSSLDEFIGESPGGEPFIVPLAIPLIAGPSALTVVTVMMASAPERWLDWTVAALIAWAGSAAILVNAPLLSRLMGRRGLLAAERLMGLLLTTIAVQMLITGIKDSFPGVG